MKQVRLTDLAERDLDEIWSYVVNRSQKRTPPGSPDDKFPAK